LTLEQFSQVVFQPCVFCGEVGYGRGIDRKNNFEGYVPGNCQACCGPCNRLKSDKAEHTFLGQILKIARYQEKIRARLLNIDQAGSAGAVVAP
jgi:hypothetical protein